MRRISLFFLVVTLLLPMFAHGQTDSVIPYQMAIFIKDKKTQQITNVVMGPVMHYRECMDQGKLIAMDYSETKGMIATWCLPVDYRAETHLLLNGKLKPGSNPTPSWLKDK